MGGPSKLVCVCVCVCLVATIVAMFTSLSQPFAEIRLCVLYVFSLCNHQRCTLCGLSVGRPSNMCLCLRCSLRRSQNPVRTFGGKEKQKEEAEEKEKD